MPKKLLTLDAANDRLTPTGIKIEQRGSKLNLRATLPRKDGAGKKQQRISLGLQAIAQGIEQAEAKAWQLASEIIQDRFDWANWVNREEKLETKPAGQWIKEFQQECQKQGKLKDPDTWRKSYWAYLKRLDQEELLTASRILKAVEDTKTNSRNRRHTCLRLNQLAEFAGIEIDLKPYQGNYGLGKSKPRDLPSDDLILQVNDSFLEGDRLTLKTKAWHWVYKILACYGLRPHEVFYCNISPNPPYECEVLEGKTGSRICYPLYPEWAEAWQVWEMLAPITTADTHYRKGHAVSRAMGRYLPFVSYDLRHAYAIRASVKFGYPVRVVSAWMGHSPELHLKIYSKWLKNADSKAVYLLGVGRDDRPKPPTSP